MAPKFGPHVKHTHSLINPELIALINSMWHEEYGWNDTFDTVYPTDGRRSYHVPAWSLWNYAVHVIMAHDDANDWIEATCGFTLTKELALTEYYKIRQQLGLYKHVSIRLHEAMFANGDYQMRECI
jgi:hypothetical protein